MIFILEIKKNGLWIDSGISSSDLQEVNKQKNIYLNLHGFMETRIMQKNIPSKVKPKKRGCC